MDDTVYLCHCPPASVSRPSTRSMLKTKCLAWVSLMISALRTCVRLQAQRHGPGGGLGVIAAIGAGREGVQVAAAAQRAQRRASRVLQDRLGFSKGSTNRIGISQQVNTSHTTSHNAGLCPRSRRLTGSSGQLLLRSRSFRLSRSCTAWLDC